ncbi:MAG: lipocalin family protein [Bacteroidales bacterium]|nr:lipocalin family protein [Bacteroidales bacterium]
MKKQRIILMLFLSAMTLAMVGCKKDPPEEPDPVLQTNLLIGKWQQSGTQVYWRFDADRHGETWDESPEEDVHEGEGTKLTWNIVSGVLQLRLEGEMGQVVPYDYTIVTLNTGMLVWVDVYNNSVTLVRQ